MSTMVIKVDLSRFDGFDEDGKRNALSNFLGDLLNDIQEHGIRELKIVDGEHPLGTVEVTI